MTDPTEPQLNVPEAQEAVTEIIETGSGSDVNLDSQCTDLAFRPAANAVVRISLASAGHRDMSAQDVIDWIAPGMPLRQAMVLLFLCQRAGLDPLSDEVCVYKQINEMSGKSDWHMLVRQQAWKRIACEHPQCAGWTFKYEGDPNKPETLVGTVEVHRKDWKVPYVHVVRWSEAASKIGRGGIPYLPKGGYCRAQPLEFLRGVTVCRALRHVFADRFGRVYAPEEFGKQ